MVKNFEDLQQVGKENVDATLKSLDKALEVQTEFAKSAYEGFVAKASKLGELYADLAKESYKPFEAMLAKAK